MVGVGSVLLTLVPDNKYIILLSYLNHNIGNINIDNVNTIIILN